MGYNYSALSDFEFEKLACDIVSKEIGTKLSCYAPGKDGGVDASDYYCDDQSRPVVIVQAKRWDISTARSKLISAMQKLVEQLQGNGRVPKTLVLVIACPLSEIKQNEVQSILGKSGAETCMVYDGVKLDQFLDDEHNADILRRHFKLWIAGSGVLQQLYCRDVFIDCGVLLADAQSQVEFFVQTSLYDKAVENLQSGATLLIVGDPGTGKTVLTKMLALYAAADGYQVLFSSCNDYAELKRSLSPPETKELIILDDFLGQRCLDVESRQLREIVSLVRYVEQSVNRRIVLNSRISILNEARRRDQFLNNLIDDMGNRVVLTNTANTSIEDRARILLANLQRFAVPDEYIANLCQRDYHGRLACQTICQHSNYNPRVIEHCSRPSFLKGCGCEEYCCAVHNALDNPAEIWRNEFEERLDKSDRLLMFQLYSLTDMAISLSTLATAFEARIASENDIDTSVDIFNVCIKRLERSMLRTILVDGEKLVSVVNPSVNDYLRCCLQSNNLEAGRIVQSAVFSEQLARIASINQSALVTTELGKHLDSDCTEDFPSISAQYTFSAGNLINVFLAAETLLVPSRFNLVMLLLADAAGVNGASSAVDRLLRTIQDSIETSDNPPAIPALKDPLVLMGLVENYSYECAGTLYAICKSVNTDDIAMTDFAESTFSAELDEWLDDFVYTLVSEEIGGYSYLYDYEIEAILNCSESFDPEDDVREFVREQLEINLPIEDFLKAAKKTFGEQLLSLCSKERLNDVYSAAIQDAIDNYPPSILRKREVSSRSEKNQASIDETQAIESIFKAWIP